MLCLGLTVAKTVLDGTFERYVKPSMTPYLLISAAVLVALAVVAIVGDIRAGGPREEAHGHGHGSGRVLWLLCAPVLVVFFLVPPALVPTSTGTTANVAAAESVVFPPLPPGEVARLSVHEVVQRATQPDGGGLTGRQVSVDGYLLSRDGRAELAQVVIICCAADARTYRVEVTGRGATALGQRAAGTWWRAVGTVVDGSASEQRRRVPQLDVVSVREIAAPKNTYGY
nr:TIGR03943 family protein [Gordonia araii]